MLIFFGHGSRCVAEYTELLSSASGGCWVWRWPGMPQTLPHAKPWARCCLPRPPEPGLAGLIMELIPGKPRTSAELRRSFSLCFDEGKWFLSCAVLLLACWHMWDVVQGGAGLPGTGRARCVAHSRPNTARVASTVAFLCFLEICLAAAPVALPSSPSPLFSWGCQVTG